MRNLDISVLIATRNRSRSLERTLDGIRRQDGLSDVKWEVIVVDNGSTDDTSMMLSRLQQHLPIVALYEPVPGQNRSFNRALEIARGKLLVFTDDDVEPSREWLSRIHAGSQRYSADSIFGGPIIPVYPLELPMWLQTILHENPAYESVAFAKFLLSKDEGPITDIPFGPNFAVRARALGRLRFNPALGPGNEGPAMMGETELLLRLRGSGERIIYLPTARVKHFVREEQIDRKWLLERAYKYGRSSARVIKRPSPGSIATIWRVQTKVPLARTICLSSLIQAQIWLAYFRGIWHESRLMAQE
jgi:glycosyltransferase involved in cell wall biosynthesis